MRVARVLAYLLFAGTVAYGQDASWQEHMTAAAALRGKGLYREALKQLEEALQAARALDRDDERQAITRDALAAAYDALGQFWQAEKCQREAVAVAERILGPENPRLGVPLNNLANIYREEGKFEAARDVGR